MALGPILKSWAVRLVAPFGGYETTNDSPLIYTDGELCSDCAKIPIRENFLLFSQHQKRHKRVYGPIKIQKNCPLCNLAAESIYFYHQLLPGNDASNTPRPTYIRHEFGPGFPLAGFAVKDITGSGKELLAGYLRQPQGRIQFLGDDRQLFNNVPSGIGAGWFTRRVKDQQMDFGLIRQWLVHCEQSKDHDCRVDSQKRVVIILIDVKKRRLVKTFSSVRYLALSYVWGQAGGLQTTKENYSTLQQEGSLNDASVPRVIEDSMELVGRIGERYLWVDRLCIIQDHRVKHTQIQQMGEIYSHALMTICAISGKDANDGLPGISPNSRQSQVIKKVQGIHCTAGFPMLDDVLACSTHNTRGWTFQELLLSHRRLFISDYQAFFMCQKDQVMSESGCDSQPPTHGTLLHINSSRTYPHSLVEAYSNRRLTYDSDVLDAFAAIPSFLNRLCPEHTWDFVAGLPLFGFVHHLLWSAKTSCVRRSARKTGNSLQHFPSWSWVGWKGAVTYKPIHGQMPTPKGCHDILTVASIHLISPSTRNEVLFKPGPSPHDTCSLHRWVEEGEDIQNQADYPVEQLVPSNLTGRDTLQFWASTVPASRFRTGYEQMDLELKTACYPLHNYSGDYIGRIFGALPGKTESNWGGYSLALLCYGPNLPHALYMSNLMGWTVGWDRYLDYGESVKWCGCRAFFMVLRDCEGYYERVGLAEIHPVAWKQEGQPQWEYITVA